MPLAFNLETGSMNAKEAMNSRAANELNIAKWQVKAQK